MCVVESAYRHPYTTTRGMLGVMACTRSYTSDGVRLLLRPPNVTLRIFRAWQSNPSIPYLTYSYTQACPPSYSRDYFTGEQE